MRRAPLVPAALWVSATALATTGAWLGVAAVTRDVTSGHTVALPPAQIAALDTTTTTARCDGDSGDGTNGSVWSAPTHP